MIRALLIAAVALALAAPVQASAPKEKKEPGSDGQYVELSVVALPVVVGGRLVNYAFVRSRVNLTARANVVKLREKEPFLRDALVRAAHRTPLNNAKEPNALDVARFKAMLLREAGAIVGAQNIKSVELNSQQPLRQVRRPPA